MKSIASIAGAAVIAIAASSATTDMTQAAGHGEFSLTILHINDLHSRIESINRFDSTCNEEGEAEGKCFGGVARIKTYLDTRRAELEAEGKNVLVLDAGDQFQGSLFYSTYKGKAAAEFADMMGFHAMAVGNHEFDDGPAALADFVAAVSFPVISGNIDVSTSPELAGILPSHVVVEVGGEKIAIVSTLAEDTVETSSPGPNVIFSSAEGHLDAVVAHFDGIGINKVIALTHMGLPRDLQMAASVSGVDAIIGGHSHTLLSNTAEKAAGPYPMMVANPDGVNVPVVQAYAYSKYVGELELTFDANGVVTAASGDTAVLDASVTPDPAVLARVKELAAPIEELKAKVVSETTAMIQGDRSVCRVEECEMGNLVADAMLERVKDQGVQIAIQNGGGLRASIDEGQITMGEVLTVLPFQNTLATFQLTGSDVVAALENGVSQVEEVKGRFPQVAGIRYTWDPAVAPMEGRIISVEVMENDAWAPIDPSKVYGVVSNNYMRGGGDGYKVFRDNGANAYDFGPGLEQVVADFLAEEGPYKPYKDGRISTAN